MPPPPIRSESYFSKVVLCILCTILMLGEVACSRETPSNAPSEINLQEFLSKNDEAWRQEIEKSSANLFYNDQELSEMVQRVKGFTGIAAETRERCFRQADKIVLRDIPAYETPEQRAAEKKEISLYAAQREEWMGFASLKLLIFAAKVSGDPRYIQKLHDVVMALCHYPQWGCVPGKVNAELTCAWFLLEVSWAYDWNKDLFSDEEKSLIRKVIAERGDAMFKRVRPSEKRTEPLAAHMWMCTANLMAAGLVFYREIPQAREWFAYGTLAYRLSATVPYDELNPDGSSFSGVPYWCAFKDVFVTAVESTKRINHLDADYYQLPHFKNATDFLIGCQAPRRGGLMWADTWLIGSGTNREVCGSEQVHGILYRMASEFHDGRAQYLANHFLTPLPDAAPGTIRNFPWPQYQPYMLMYYDPTIQENSDLKLDYLFPDWGTVTTRSGWGDDDYLFSFRAGYNVRNHSHLETGAISLNYAGTWFLLSPGISTRDHSDSDYWNYAQKRWDYFSASSESVCTLVVNGKNQRYDRDAGGKIDSYIAAPSVLWTEADLKAAYAGVDKIRRRILHRRGDYILVLDEVSAKSPVKVEWLAQVPPSLTNVEPGALAISDGKSLLTVRNLEKALEFAPRSPHSPIDDVSKIQQTTYAMTKEGTEVRFAVLLEPRKCNAKVPPLTFSKDEEGAFHVKGGDWEDTVILNSDAESAKGALAAVTAKACVIRRIRGKISSVLASESTTAELNAFQMESTEPASWVWDEATSTLALTSEFKGKIKIAKHHKAAKQLVDERGAFILTKETLSLPPGKYRIQ